MSTDYADIFEKAADHIEKVGLHKGWFFKNGMGHDVEDTAPCCAWGALKVACGDRNVYTHEGISTEAVIQLADVLGIASVPEWNDKPHQRKGRVVKALRKAAEKVKAEGVAA